MVDNNKMIIYMSLWLKQAHAILCYINSEFEIIMSG